MENRTDNEQITQLVNKLFVYTDEQQWEKLINEVFTDSVVLNVTSLGGPNEEMTAGGITEMWKEGFKGLDAVNHLGGNYLIDIDGQKGEVFAYATATHYKKDATQGTTREFVGTYNLGIERFEAGSRINSFKYNLKYMTGNTELK